MDYDVEPSIVEACSPEKLFIEDIVRVTQETAKRPKHYHKAFAEDYEAGAFDRIEKIYR